MSKTYEAIYEDGDLHWVGSRPQAGRHRVLVTVLEARPVPRDRSEVRQMLEATRGAWGSDKALEQIDAEIRRLRDEWDRTG